MERLTMDTASLLLFIVTPFPYIFATELAAFYFLGRFFAPSFFKNEQRRILAAKYAKIVYIISILLFLLMFAVLHTQGYMVGLLMAGFVVWPFNAAFFAVCAYTLTYALQRPKTPEA